jgi:hypothetical protein
MPALLTMTSRRPNVVHRGGDQGLQVVHLAHVGLDPDDLVAQGPHLLLEVVLGLLGGDVVDDDVGALGGQGQHHRLAPMPVLPPVTMATLPLSVMSLQSGGVSAVPLTDLRPRSR